MVGVTRADDVKVDGEAGRGEAARDGGGGLAGEVEGVGERHPVGAALVVGAGRAFPADVEEIGGAGSDSARRMACVRVLGSFSSRDYATVPPGPGGITG